MLSLNYSDSPPSIYILKDIFWNARAQWYLLGIQLDVDHSDLEVSESTSCQLLYNYVVTKEYSGLCITCHIKMPVVRINEILVSYHCAVN